MSQGRIMKGLLARRSSEELLIELFLSPKAHRKVETEQKELKRRLIVNATCKIVRENS